MQKYNVEIIAWDDNFEPGDCTRCPVGREERGYDDIYWSCGLHADFENCPLKSKCDTCIGVACPTCIHGEGIEEMYMPKMYNHKCKVCGMVWDDTHEEDPKICPQCKSKWEE